MYFNVSIKQLAMHKIQKTPEFLQCLSLSFSIPSTCGAFVAHLCVTLAAQIRSKIVDCMQFFHEWIAYFVDTTTGSFPYDRYVWREM